MVWTSMLAMIVLSAVAFHVCFKQYRYMSNLSDDDLDRIESDRWDQNLDIDMTSLIKVQLDSILSNRKVWLLFTILTGTIFFILFITFIFLRKRVRIAISLIREASKSVFGFSFFFICIYCQSPRFFEREITSQPELSGERTRVSFFGGSLSFCL